MPHVLIEDIAKAMEQDPNQLSALQSRKYCILIDWALTLVTHEQVDEPHTPLLKLTEIDSEQCRSIIDAIAKALKANEFKDLDKQKPDIEEMDNMMSALCPYLGYKKEVMSKIETNFIGDYEREIKRQGFVYTKSLTYQPRFKPDAPEVTQQNVHLMQSYNKLKDLKLFTAGREQFFTENQDKQLAVSRIDTLSANKSLAVEHAASVVVFYLEIIKGLKLISAKQNVKCHEADISNLLSQITLLIKNIAPSSANQIAVLEIGNLLRDILPKDKQDPSRPQIAKILSHMMVNHDVLRSFKTFNSIPKDQTVARVILIGPEDLADYEVISSLELILKNHPKENIIVTFNESVVEKVNQRNSATQKPFTLHAIGHGSVTVEQKMNANIGTHRGDAATVGASVAKLVNKCNLIDHVRITGCFSGLMREKANLKLLREKTHIKITDSAEYRRTLTLVTDDNLNDTNSPFAGGTVAVNCWNNIDKTKRQISMTVSPGIIEPDKEFGRMMWKSTPSAPKEQEGIKEVRVTTSGGPKNKFKY